MFNELAKEKEDKTMTKTSLSQQEKASDSLGKVSLFLLIE